MVFVYTIKGWGLPFAGEALNHSMLLSAEQIAGLQQELDIASGREWNAFHSVSPEGRWYQNNGDTVFARRAPRPHRDGAGYLGAQLSISGQSVWSADHPAWC
ncbi:MAG: hypothetical protein NVSMB27_15080 [Ktedonobacteraceae bacterium]